MLTREGSTKIINLMTPRAGVPVLGHVHIGHIVKMHYFSEDLLYSWPLYRQTEYKVLISMEASTKILNFMTPWAGVPVLGCGHISHILKMHYFFENLLYSWLSCRVIECIIILNRDAST